MGGSSYKTLSLILVLSFMLIIFTIVCLYSKTIYLTPALISSGLLLFIVYLDLCTNVAKKTIRWAIIFGLNTIVFTVFGIFFREPLNIPNKYFFIPACFFLLTILMIVIRPFLIKNQESIVIRAGFKISKSLSPIITKLLTSSEREKPNTEGVRSKIRRFLAYTPDINIGGRGGRYSHEQKYNEQGKRVCVVCGRRLISGKKYCHLHKGGGFRKHSRVVLLGKNPYAKEWKNPFRK